MHIKRIQASNFKSFKKIDLELGNFNIFIGANASGKSNFVSILQFIKDIAVNGLENAISMQGGIDYIRNVNLDIEKELNIRLELDCREKKRWVHASGKREFGIELCNVNYEFRIKFTKKESEYKISYEKLDVIYDIFKINSEPNDDLRKNDIIQRIEMTFNKEKNKISRITKPEDINLEEYDLFPSRFLEKQFVKEEFAEKNLMITHSFIFPPISIEIIDFFKQISIYDIEPKISKKANLITGKKELESDGRNLALVLNYILKNRVEGDKISTLIKEALPFIANINIKKMVDKSLITSLEEIYSPKTFFPAPLISDGTINLTAMIIILFYEKKPVIVIEEPERNLHPILISKLINMMKDVSTSRNKQVIITTHNPMIVRYGDIQDLYLIKRDLKGFSEISKPMEKNEIKVFLKRDLGIDELFVNNLLG